MANPKFPAVTRAAGRVQKITRRWPVTLCNAAGDISPGESAAVPGEPGMVWCVMPDGSPVKAYNGRVPHATGVRAWAGYEPHNPNFFRILDFNVSYQAAPGGGTGGIGAHAPNHEWLSWDTLYSRARQLMPLRISVASGMTVRIEPSALWTASGWVLSPAGTLDLAADVPTAGQRYELIYLTAAGALSKRAGTAVTSLFTPLTYADIPALGPGERALAAIRLFAGQTDIAETAARQDIVDLRFAAAPAPRAAGDQGWFNVQDYGAAGDNTADDTAAVAATIAALTAAGGGVLYFPKGEYKTTGGFTISVPALVLGSGRFWGVSTIKCTSATAVLFTVTAPTALFSNLTLWNTSGTTPTAGAAVSVHGTPSPSVSYDNCTISSFYIDVDVQIGVAWTMRGCEIRNPVLYGLKIRNTATADEGDWSISDCLFLRDTAAAPAAAIRIESSGGGKITNVKINGAFTYGLNLNVTGTTTILLLTNVSIENWATHAIYATDSGGASWNHIVISGCQFGGYGSTTPAIFFNATALGQLCELVITDCVFRNTSGGAFAVSLTKVRNAFLSGLVNDGYGAVLTQSGTSGVAYFGLAGTLLVDTAGAADTNVLAYHAATGTWLPATAGGTVTSVALTVPAELAVSGSPITGSGTLAITKANQSANQLYAGPASGAAAAPAFRALVPADVGSGTPTGTKFLRDDLTWQAVAAGGGQVLMTGAAPPDPITNEANTDWLYE